MFAQTYCGGSGLAACVDVGTDSLNCGGCGIRCPNGTTCDRGQCGCGLGGGLNLTNCGGSGINACVDTDSDPFNCGGCTIRCGSGVRCLNGECAPSIEPTPIAGEDVPYGVDGVTVPSLTDVKFMFALPDSFAGQRRLTDVPPDMANASLHPRLTNTSAAYYNDPDSSDPFVITAVAMVGSVPAGLSVATVVSQVKSGNAARPSFSVIDEDTSPDAAFPFVRFQVWVNDAVGTAYYLVWGERDGDRVYLLSAISLANLESLAEAFVLNAR